MGTKLFSPERFKSSRLQGGAPWWTSCIGHVRIMSSLGSHWTTRAWGPEDAYITRWASSEGCRVNTLACSAWYLSRYDIQTFILFFLIFIYTLLHIHISTSCLEVKMGRMLWKYVYMDMGYFNSSMFHHNIFSTSVKRDCGINWIPHAFPLLIRGSWILNPLAATLGCASFNLSHFHN